MYNLEDINMLVKNPDKIYAHRMYIGGIVDYETLEEHSKRVLKYFSIILMIDISRHITPNNSPSFSYTG